MQNQKQVQLDHYEKLRKKKAASGSLNRVRENGDDATNMAAHLKSEEKRIGVHGVKKVQRPPVKVCFRSDPGDYDKQGITGI